MKFISIILSILFLTSCLTPIPQSLTVNKKSGDDIYKEAVITKEKGILIKDFSDKKWWFGCNGTPVKIESGVLVAEFDKASYTCIGGKLFQNDFSDNQVIAIKLKAVSDNFKDDLLTFKVRLEDINGVETNYDEETFEMPINQDFQVRELDFRGKVVAVNGTLDQQNVMKMKIFFNTAGSDKFTGKVYIDEIRIKPGLSDF